MLGIDPDLEAVYYYSYCVIYAFTGIYIYVPPHVELVIIILITVGNKCRKCLIANFQSRNF